MFSNVIAVDTYQLIIETWSDIARRFITKSKTTSVINLTIQLLGNVIGVEI